MQRKFNFVVGEVYHIFNRGVERRAIFNEHDDRNRLQELFYLANSRKPLVYKLIQGSPFSWDRGNTIVDIFAYTLMPNHVHMIGRENSEGSLSKFMSKLFTAYSMYFNTKYERSGPLFCHPFRARHIDNDDYFRWVFSYVHLNPLCGVHTDTRAAKDFLKRYWHSSYIDYFGTERSEGKILSRKSLPIEIADLENIDRMLATKPTDQKSKESPWTDFVDKLPKTEDRDWRTSHTITI